MQSSNPSESNALNLGPEADAKLLEFEDQVMRFELRIIESIGFLGALRAKQSPLVYPTEPIQPEALRNDSSSTVNQPTSGPAIANCR